METIEDILKHAQNAIIKVEEKLEKESEVEETSLESDLSHLVATMQSFTNFMKPGEHDISQLNVSKTDLLESVKISLQNLHKKFAGSIDDKIKQEHISQRIPNFSFQELREDFDAALERLKTHNIKMSKTVGGKESSSAL